MTQPIETVSLKTQKINFSNAMSALLPILISKRTQPIAVPSLLFKNRGERVSANLFQPSIISKKLISRRPTKTIDGGRGNKVQLQSTRPKSRINKTITDITNQNQLDEIHKSLSVQKRFRIKKIDEKYIKPCIPTLNCYKSMYDINDNFSQNLIKSAAPTEVLYLNPKLPTNEIAILNIDNFHQRSQVWKNATKDKLTSSFKQILQGISSEFSVVLRSEEMETKAQNILSQLMENNIQILAWINVSKTHSVDKLYNLSDVLRIIGTLSKIWVFEQSNTNNLNNLIFPIFQQAANVSIVLYKKQSKSDLKNMNPEKLQKLRKTDKGRDIMNQLSSLLKIQNKAPMKPIFKCKQQYDVGEFRNKLIQQFKILKNSRKPTTSSSVNYLVGDLIKRNYQIFQDVISAERKIPINVQQFHIQESQYQIQILSL